MPKIGPVELAIVLVIVLLIFGAGKLPQIGNALGKSIREFRKAKEEPLETPASNSNSAAVQSPQSEGKARTLDQGF